MSEGRIEINLWTAPGFRDGAGNTACARAVFMRTMDRVPTARRVLSSLGIRVFWGPPDEMLRAGIDPQNADAFIQRASYGSPHAKTTLAVTGRGRANFWVEGDAGLEASLVHETAHIVYPHMEDEIRDEILAAATDDAAVLRNICARRLQVHPYAPLADFMALTDPGIGSDGSKALADPRDRVEWTRDVWFAADLAARMDPDHTLSGRMCADPATCMNYWKISMAYMMARDAIAEFMATPPADSEQQRDFILALESLRDEVVAHFIEVAWNARLGGEPFDPARWELAERAVHDGLDGYLTFRSRCPEWFREVAGHLRDLMADGHGSPSGVDPGELASLAEALRQTGGTVSANAAMALVLPLAEDLGRSLGAPLLHRLVSLHGPQGAANVLKGAGAHLERWLSSGTAPVPLADHEHAEIASIVAVLPCIGFALSTAKLGADRQAGHWQKWPYWEHTGHNACVAMMVLTDAYALLPAISRMDAVAHANDAASRGEQVAAKDAAILAWSDPAIPFTNGLLPEAAHDVSEFRHLVLTGAKRNGLGPFWTPVGRGAGMMYLLTHPDGASLRTDFALAMRGSVVEISTEAIEAGYLRGALRKLWPDPDALAERVIAGLLQACGHDTIPGIDRDKVGILATALADDFPDWHTVNQLDGILKGRDPKIGRAR